MTRGLRRIKKKKNTAQEADIKGDKREYHLVRLYGNCYTPYEVNMPLVAD